MKTLRFTLLSAVLILTGCKTVVDPRPNECLRKTENQSLVIANDTANPLTLLPRQDASAEVPALTVPPGGRTTLPFILCDEVNKSASGEHEIVLQDGSSPYLVLSDIDLKLRARFNGGAEKEIRVGTGDCLFEASANGKAHELHLKRPPLPGVPPMRLCP
ncbi:MAG TPA: hypothetical protein VHM91_24115 [Verrucomicrobiales bacterium]|jgi:hypothetical protein|nr:hypothetical protein [Verrucomicrobiales bacterium]